MYEVMKNSFFVTMLVCLFFLSPFVIFAQESGNTGRPQPSRYLIGQEEQMLLPVNILGLVAKPGQYMVPFRTDLVSLIAFAGGFRENAKITEVKIIRNAIDKKSLNKNFKNTGKAQVFTVNIKKYFEDGDIAQIPQLKPDDTILIKGTAARSVNKFFDFLGKLAIIGQLAFYVAVVQREF